MRNVRLSPGSRQRGLSFMVVLIALASLALAALALVRSIDTGTLLMGNLGFKEGAVAAADDAVTSADTWLTDKINNTPTDLYGSICSSGCDLASNAQAYYPTSLDALDIAGHSADTTRILIDWNDKACADAATGSFSSCLKASQPVQSSDRAYTTQFVVTRMCNIPGDPGAAGNNCSSAVAVAAVDRQINKGEIKYGKLTALPSPGGGAGGARLMYRVIVRSVGPRNTVSYTETYLSTVPSS